MAGLIDIGMLIVGFSFMMYKESRLFRIAKLIPHKLAEL